MVGAARGATILAVVASVAVGGAATARQPSPSATTASEAGTAETHRTLLPRRVQRLTASLLLTSFDQGVSHVGGPVRAMRLTERRVAGRTVGVALEAVLADQGYPTPAAYQAAGRDPVADVAAVLGRPASRAAAAPGQVVQSGCSKIDVPSYYYAYGCYTRKLAQNITNGEILGETGNVTCHSRFYDMVQCGAELQHAWIDRYAYIYPTRERRKITGQSSGAVFGNSWYGKVRNEASRSSAVVDTYRWQIPAKYRGDFRYVILVDTSPGDTKRCSGTCTTR